MDWKNIIGLKGVASDENNRAKFCSQLLEWPMLAATLWVISLWYLSGKSPEFVLTPVHDLALWALFIFETLLLTLLVNNSKRYLRTNWLNLAIILLGIPILWGSSSYGFTLRALRLLILFSMLAHVTSSLNKLLSLNSLGPVILSSLIVVVMAGFMIAAIDPGIKTAADGIWWAWVTVTTVGYGDVVPSSSVGRLFAAFLILIGIGLFAALTANFAAFFIRDAERKQQLQLIHVLHRLERIEATLSDIEEHLKNKNEDRDKNHLE